MPRISLRYDAPVIAIVNTETRKVESVTVQRSLVEDETADLYDVDEGRNLDWVARAEDGQLIDDALEIKDTADWPDWMLEG